MSLGQPGTVPSPGEGHETLDVSRIDGMNVTQHDRFFAPIEAETPLDDADLQRHKEKIMPGIARTMRNLSTGRAEARSHAPPRTRKEVDQGQINAKSRRKAAMLRQISRTSKGFSFTREAEDGLLA